MAVRLFAVAVMFRRAPRHKERYHRDDMFQSVWRADPQAWPKPISLRGCLALPRRATCARTRNDGSSPLDRLSMYWSVAEVLSQKTLRITPRVFPRCNWNPQCSRPRRLLGSLLIHHAASARGSRSPIRGSSACTVASDRWVPARGANRPSRRNTSGRACRSNHKRSDVALDTLKRVPGSGHRRFRSAVGRPGRSSSPLWWRMGTKSKNECHGRTGAGHPWHSLRGRQPALGQ